ncbi:MAG: SMC-Scp complex subunit ScpB [Clostridia bacterium]|nr:SMC-Scp complex subunit ScpB [Clostridia bacterium]
MPNEKNTPETEELLGSVQDVERAIEAILFAAGYPVKYEKLSEVIGLPQRDLRNLIAHMAENYRDRGIQLLLYPDTCQLTTKEIFAPYVREALGIKRGGNLSNSSLEVLAVVAYNQPVTRSYVDIIRGVDSSYTVGLLLERELIEEAGRLAVPGRPILYRTTKNFLRTFGLSDLNELPELPNSSPEDGQITLEMQAAVQRLKQEQEAPQSDIDASAYTDEELLEAAAELQKRDAAASLGG